MNSRTLNELLVGWFTILVVTALIAPLAATIIHLKEAVGRLGLLPGAIFSLEYAWLPVLRITTTLVAGVAIIVLPVQLLLRRYAILGTVFGALVLGLLGFLGLAAYKTDRNSLLFEGYGKLWRPDLDGTAIFAAVAVVIACTAGAILATKIGAKARPFLVVGAVSVGIVAVTAFVAPYVVPASTGRNVLLVCLDTLRADHLGFNGYPLDTSPELDRLAVSGVVFHRAVSQAPWTLPAHMSLFSGLYPTQHGLTEYPPDRKSWRAVSPQIPLLAELIHDAGRVTAAFTGGVFVDPAFGFDRGFDMYRTEGPRLEAYQPAVRRWLRRHRHVPFFLFVHAYNCHKPYNPPSEDAKHFLPERLTEVAERVDGFCGEAEHSGILPTADLLDAVIAHYDGEVRFADRLVGGILAELRNTGLDERTLVVFISDHGDEFFEHGNCDHIKSLYEPLLRVPLIIAGPEVAAGRAVTETVELREVGQLVLDALGVQENLAESTHKLWQLASGEKQSDAGAVAFAETYCKGYTKNDGGWVHAHCKGEIHSVQNTRFKIIANRDGLPLEVYDIVADPGEQDDLLANLGIIPNEAEGLVKRLQEHIELVQANRIEPTPGWTLDAATEDELRALGYME